MAGAPVQARAEKTLLHRPLSLSGSSKLSWTHNGIPCCAVGTKLIHPTADASTDGLLEWLRWFSMGSDGIGCCELFLSHETNATCGPCWILNDPRKCSQGIISQQSPRSFQLHDPKASWNKRSVEMRQGSQPRLGKFSQVPGLQELTQAVTTCPVSAERLASICPHEVPAKAGGWGILVISLAVSRTLSVIRDAKAMFGMTDHLIGPISRSPTNQADMK